MASNLSDAPSSNSPDVLNDTVGGVVVHTHRNGGVIFKPTGKRHIGTAHVDEQNSLTGHVVGGEQDGADYRPGVAFAGSDKARQTTRGKLPISSSVDEALIEPVGRSRFDNAHLELKAPGGGFWRIHVNDDGTIGTTAAPAVEAPGKAAPAPRLTLLSRAGVAIATADKPSLSVVG